MYEYGNARIAALRGRLLPPGVLHQLAESESPAALLEHLARLDDWQPFAAAPYGKTESPAAGATGADPARAVLATIERHRFARLGTLPRWYPPPARTLVEALVIPLDCERAVALLRLRIADVEPAVALERAGAGAVLDARQLAEIVRAPTLGGSVRLLGEAGVIEVRAARRLAALCDRGEAWVTVEAGLADACFEARRARATGTGAAAAHVREVLAAEHAAAHAVVVELSEQGIESAASLERRSTLARLDQLARRARRDPLGIGVVAGYVAAVEAQAIRLRAILGRVAGRWNRERAAGYMPVAGG